MMMIVFSLLFILPLSSASTERTDEEVLGLYQKWQAQHGKAHNGLQGIRGERFEIFKNNLKFIDEHNSVNRPYKLGLNKFADLTNEEYRAKFLGTRPSYKKTLLGLRKPSLRYWPWPSDRLPRSIDWRKLGAVTEVKDQGQCGKDLATSSFFQIDKLILINLAYNLSSIPNLLISF